MTRYTFARRKLHKAYKCLRKRKADLESAGERYASLPPAKCTRWARDRFKSREAAYRVASSSHARATACFCAESVLAESAPKGQGGKPARNAPLHPALPWTHLVLFL